MESISGILKETYYGNTAYDWMQALAIIVAAVLVGRFAYWIFKNVAHKLTAKTDTRLDDIIIDMIEEPIVVILTVMGVGIAFKSLSFVDHPGVDNFIANAITAAIVLSITWLFARLIDSLIEEYVVPRVAESETDLDDQLLPVLRKGAKLGIWILGIIVALQNAEQDVGALLAGLGVGGLALAIAAQDTVANIFGGATIFADRPFVIGDRVRVGGYDGVMREIGIRSSRMETRDGAIVTMPNSKFTGSAVENVSAGIGRRIVTTLGLTYDTTADQMEKAMDILREIAAETEGVGDDVKVSFAQWGDFAMGIRLAYFVMPDANFRKTQNGVNMAILRRFGAEGLDFAYPTQTLYNISAGGD